MTSRLTRAKAFTLIELLVVIAIIGVLAVTLLPRITEGPQKARDVKRKTALNDLMVAMELYYTNNGEYPSDGTVPYSECLSSTGTVGSALLDYMPAIPVDPNDLASDGSCSGGEYYYRTFGYSGGNTASSFMMITALEEEEADSDGVYCDLDIDSYSTYSDATAGLAANAGPCAAGETAYFVILR